MTVAAKKFHAGRGCYFDLLLLVVLLLVVFLIAYLCAVDSDKIFFNYNTGFYSNDLSIVLSRGGLINSSPEYKLRYTMNGDRVGYDSMDGDAPIELAVPESGYTVYAIKAAMCNVDNICKHTYYATYVLGKDLDSDVDIQIASITSSHENLYDYEHGILVPGKNYDESTDKYMQGNYYGRGKDWVRDAHITMIDADGGIVYDDDIGIEVSGGTSSEMDVKSLKILSNDSEHDFPFFGGKYNSLRLRSGSQDQTQGNIRSAVVSRLAEESGYNGCPGTIRTAVFLNNEFYGLFDMQQTISESFFSNVYGVESPRLTEKYKGSEKDVLVASGIRGLFNHSSWDKNNLEKLESSVNIDDYLRYYSLQMMWNNTDWISNNYGLWRNSGFDGGRYSFFIYDTDIVYYSSDNIQFFGDIDSDIFVEIMENHNIARDNTFRSVIKSSAYREKFIEIMRGLINGPFKTENVLRIIDEEAAKIDHQMKLFYSDEKYEEWKGWIDLMRRTAAKREGEVRADVKKYFGVDL